MKRKYTNHFKKKLLQLKNHIENSYSNYINFLKIMLWLFLHLKLTGTTKKKKLF